MMFTAQTMQYSCHTSCLCVVDGAFRVVVVSSRYKTFPCHEQMAYFPRRTPNHHHMELSGRKPGTNV